MNEFSEALDAFKAATAALDAAWVADENGDVPDVDGYPDCLPSFDEFALEVRGMQAR